MRPTRRIICIGCAFWDTIMRVEAVPAGGGKVLAEQVIQNASGMATVAAVAIARLGGNAALWSRIGDDLTGRLFLEDIARDAVDVAQVRRLPGARTWLSTILVDRTGERLVVSHRPPLDPDPSWLPLDEIAAAGAVLADMRWPEAARAAFAEARRHGVATILDADVAPPDELRAMIPLADHVLFSEPALASLMGAASLADQDVEGALLSFASDAEVVGVTLGSRGAVIIERSGVVHCVPAPVIAAIDTLNA